MKLYSIDILFNFFILKLCFAVVQFSIEQWLWDHTTLLKKYIFESYFSNSYFLKKIKLKTTK